MKKFYAVAPVALALCCSLAHADGTTPAATPTPAPVTFQLNLTPGQVRSQKMTVDITGTMNMAQGAMPLNMAMTAFTKTYVDKKNDDGTYAVRYKVGGMKMTMNGSPMPLPAGQDGVEIKANISKDGRVNTADTEKGGGMPGMQMDPTSMMKSMLTNNVVFPDHAVNVGDTWKTTVAMPMDPTGKSHLDVTNTLESVDVVGGQRVARVKSITEGPLNVSMTQPVPMTMTGTINGSNMFKMDLDSGLPISGEGTTKTHMNMAVDNQAGNGEKMNMSMDMNMKLHIEPASVAAITPAKKPASASN